MTDPSPEVPVSLSALLSFALVAFTVEFDNAFEHLTPHRTTDHGGPRSAPWLVSMVMWSNLLQYVDDDGVTVVELQRRTGSSDKALQTWLTRLSAWWGYVTVEGLTTKSKKVSAGALVRPTPGGQQALNVWRPLAATIEGRWRERFGGEAINRLRAALWAIVRHLDPALPDAVPVLGYGLFSRDEDDAPPEDSRPLRPDWPLSTLLSKTLLTFARDYERDFGLSLGLSADALRLIRANGVRLRDLPRLAGVSKEAIDMAVGFLEKGGFVTVQTENRVKSLVLTEKGQLAQAGYLHQLASVEAQWRVRFGDEAINALRAALEALTPDRLLGGMQPYPDGWRSAIARPEVLPHYPMVLHRGGFPDGS